MYFPSNTQTNASRHPATDAYIINRRWDIIGYNRLVRIVFPMIPRLDDPDVRNGSLATNVLHFMFLNPMSQQIIVEWEKHVERIVKEFRTDYGKHNVAHALSTR